NTKEYWYIFTDKNDKGKSTVANEVSGNNYKLVLDDGTGNYAAAIESFILNKGASDNDPFVAIGLDTKKNGSTYNLSECVDGFSYKYKGVAHSFKAQLSTVKDYNYHFVSVANSTVWKTVSIQFSDFEQADWGKTVAFNPAAITAFHWEVKASPLTGNLWVDDFYCLGGDLGINPASSSSTSPKSSSSVTEPEDPTTIIAHSKLQELSVSFNNKTRQISLQNPSSDRIWVDIYDMQGNNIMFSKELKQSISLENIPNGNYLVRIRNTKNHRVFSIKLH
ncbi:MAG: T9SS type A sorting domain-containing protein, partial [Fibrobacter sp.]|nr:T9SS type A sorting domain-containing protein [Fibrobacter sp.]